MPASLAWALSYQILLILLATSISQLYHDMCICEFVIVILVSKITIASVNDRLKSDKSLIPGVPLVAEAISTDKRFMQYRKYILIV